MASSDSIVGVPVVAIDLTLTLPPKRKDGTALEPKEIQSATVLRDSGAGPVELKFLPGPFTGATVLYTDATPATGNDIYSFYVTDTAGTKSATSVPVMVTVSGDKVLAAPAASTLTAVPTPEKSPEEPKAPGYTHSRAGDKLGEVHPNQTTSDNP